MQPLPIFGKPRRSLGVGGFAASYSQRILNSAPIAYWPLNDTTGTVARELKAGNNGAYAGTFTLAQNGLGDGGLYPSFGGGRVSLATPLTALNTLFNPLEGTVTCWAKVSAAGVWTDATARMNLEFGVDANNRVFIQRTATNGQLQWSYRAGGTAENVTLTTASPLTWMHLGLTWNKAADRVIAYFNGVQTGATQTTLGVWAGSLASGFTALADFSSAGSSPWSGFEAHCALYNRELTAAEIAGLYVAAYAA